MSLAGSTLTGMGSVLTAGDGGGSGSGLTPAQTAQLNALPGPWTVVGIGADNNLTDIWTARSGDVDLAYEIEFTCANTSDTNTHYTLQLGLDGGAPGITGESQIRIFGNNVGPNAFSDAPPEFQIADSSNAANGQNPNTIVRVDAVRTGLPRIFRMWATRGAAPNGAMYMGGGQMQAAGNITSARLISSTASGIKAGSLLRWRRVGS